MTNSTPLPEYALHFPTTDGGQLTLPNPFRGTLIVGATGAGKTSSLAGPMTEQFARKNFAGLIYSADGALASKALITAMGEKEPWPPTDERVQRRTLDFYDVSRSEKVNPLHPSLITSATDALEFALNLLASLRSDDGTNSTDWGDFFNKSTGTYLAAIIWFYRQHHPALCTLPHVLATVKYDDFTNVLSMVSKDEECKTLVQSLITAVEQDADKQVAGVLAALQVDTMDLLSPALCWVLSPDEAKGEGFSLHLNDPSNPALLTIGNDPTLPARFRGAYSAIISCVISQALKQMSRPHQHHSYVLLDDAETLHVPTLEVLAVTARSNQLALVYVTQDLPALTATYSKDKAQVIMSNLNNHLFGKIVGYESGVLLASLVSPNDVGSSQVAERVKDAFLLNPGEFIGQVAVPYAEIFHCALVPPQEFAAPAPVEPAVVSDGLALAMDELLHSVRHKATEMVRSYFNSLSKENRYGKR